ncbi:MAG TPA: hypothetical protein VF622_02475 [Segetibacter sp.]
MTEDKNKPEEGDLPSEDGKQFTSDDQQPTNEPLTTNSNLQTIEMEVHHHGHVHEKKKWKEYVFQFFMLFLAVFCGFLAEYKLEQTIEHHREEQYVNSLINDIKSDTAAAQVVINDFKKRYPGLDSMVNSFEDAMNGKSEVFFRNRNSIGGFEDFHLSDGTMQQLKSAGGLRLIRNGPARDSILKYDSYTKDIINQQTFLANEVFQKAWDSRTQCLDNLKIAKLVAEFKKTNKIPTLGYIFSTKDYQKLNEYYSRLVSLRGNFLNWIKELGKLQAQGERLITTLKKEYDIE